MATAFYRNGVVTVTKGSKVVTGNHTTWTGGATKPLPGDVFVFNNKLYEVEVIVSDTELTLYREFEDDTQVDQEYVIMRNASLNISSRIAAAVAIAINQKQQQLDEFNNFLTNTTDPTVEFTDTLGNKVTVVPIPELEREINQLIEDSSNIANLVQQAVDAKDGAVAAESNVTAMRDEVTQMKTEVTNMHDDVNTWQQEVSDNKDLAEQAAQATAEDKLATAQDVIDAGNSATAASESATAANTAKEASEAIQADVTSKHGDVEQWHTEVLAAKDSVDASETHVDEVKAEIDALKLDMDSTASEVSDIKDDIDAKYLQINSWHTETGELKDDAEAAAVKAEAAAQSVSDLEWKQYCQPQANMLANRLLVNNEFAASGMVHSGKHNLDAINEGLWVDISIPNKVFLGGGLNGTSETAHAVMNIAGALCEITTNWTFEAPSSNPDIANRVDMFGIELKELPVTDKVYPLGDLSATPVDWETTNKKEFVSNPYNNIFLMPDDSLIQLCWAARVVTGTRNWDWSNLWPSQGPLQYDDGVVFEGYSDTSNVGVFKHESEDKYFYVCGRVPRLNDAAYNNQNFMGSYKFNDEKFWYETGADSLTLEDAFLNVSSNKDTSGRTDGKRAQFIYPSGQGGVIDYRLPARDMGAPEDGAKVFQKVVNGTYRGEERLNYSLARDVNSVNGNVNYKYMYFSDPSLVSLFKSVYGLSANQFQGATTGSGFPGDSPAKFGGFIARDGVTVHPFIGIGLSSDGSLAICVTTDLGYEEYRTDFTTSIQFVVSGLTEIEVSGEFTMVNAVGEPTNLMKAPVLSNGWIGGWIPKIPPNSPYQMTRKCLDSGSLPVVFSDDYVNWSSGAGVINTIANEFSGVSVAGRIGVIAYTAFAKQTKESVNKVVLNNVKGLGSVVQLARNDYSLLAESLMGKVCTSAATKDLGQLELESYTFEHTNTSNNNNHKLSVHASYPVKHSPVDMAVPSNDSPALKALWHQAANNQQATLNFLWNELVWSDVRFLNLSANSNTLTAYTLYGVTYNCPLQGCFFIRKTDGGLTLDGRYKQGRGISYGNIPVGDVTNYHVYENTENPQWGDDSTIRITDGTGTFINLNGDTCLYGTSELAIPYGYTKNQARAGSQVPGVDL